MVNKFDAGKLTQIIFSFCHLEGARLHVDNAKDTLTIQNLVALKKSNPSLKVLLSLGGWGGCKTCSDVFSSKKSRQKFAHSVKELNTFFGTDGIDLDWEYPAIEGYPGHSFMPADKENFTDLIKQLRKALGKKSEISFAAGGFKKFIDESVEWKKVMKLVDRVNLMTYDLVNGYSKQTGHHTALYATPQQTEATDIAVQRLLQIKIPRNKIVIGAAFYGRVWENVPAQNNGLYQSGTFKTSTAFKEFETSLSPQAGFTYYWDDVAKAPYLYNKDKKLFVTYDDPRSIKLKTKYAIDKGLNGIMFWQLTQDTYSNGLLDAIDAAKKNNNSNRPSTK
jgi:chitinase